ncbi:tRNA pseudouridine synthase-like 1 isoform X2 [Amia ocellicauda]|uniref:tRNA pseudouridine synthase-like 1 isoform X2 n=1 Tax=Amia ocellicauda TaxID=2972642 RepID=UPI003463ABEB
MTSCKVRYLIFFQYYGSKYSGVTKTPPHQPGQGVQNYLEDAIRRLRPVNEVCVSVSSRTDAGVHALCNSAHLDLQRRGDLPPFPEEVLTDAINYHLKPEPIRDLDIEAMQAAGMVLLGQHDFSTFRALNSDTPFKSPVKTLLRAEVTVGQDSFTPHSFRRGMRCWELTFQSRSFLYKQVRRMTGAMVAVGLGRLTLSRLQELLEARDSLAFPQNMSAPPDGLFLKRVDYEDSDLSSCSRDLEIKP